MGRFERMRGNLVEMKERGNESARRMLQMMFGTQGELVLKSAFIGWKDVVSVLMQEREVENLKRGMKANGEERIKRMLLMLMGSQTELLKKAVFSGWRDYVMELRQQNNMKEMQRRLRAKGAENAKRML